MRGAVMQPKSAKTMPACTSTWPLSTTSPGDGHGRVAYRFIQRSWVASHASHLGPRDTCSRELPVHSSSGEVHGQELVACRAPCVMRVSLRPQGTLLGRSRPGLGSAGPAHHVQDPGAIRTAVCRPRRAADEDVPKLLYNHGQRATPTEFPAGAGPLSALSSTLPHDLLFSI